jgi:hypothetical protein
MPDTASSPHLLLRSFELFSPLSPPECMARLSLQTKSQTLPLQGAVDHEYFRLSWRNLPDGSAYIRNSFNPVLFGLMRPSGSGTLMRCHFTLARSVLFFIFVCATVTALAGDARVFFPMMLFTLSGIGMSWGERQLLINQVRIATSARFVPSVGHPP